MTCTPNETFWLRREPDMYLLILKFTSSRRGKLLYPARCRLLTPVTLSIRRGVVRLPVCPMRLSGKFVSEYRAVRNVVVLSVVAELGAGLRQIARRVLERVERSR